MPWICFFIPVDQSRIWDIFWSWWIKSRSCQRYHKAQQAKILSRGSVWLGYSCLYSYSDCSATFGIDKCSCSFWNQREKPPERASAAALFQVEPEGFSWSVPVFRAEWRSSGSCVSNEALLSGSWNSGPSEGVSLWLSLEAVMVKLDLKRSNPHVFLSPLRSNE